MHNIKQYWKTIRKYRLHSLFFRFYTYILLTIISLSAVFFTYMYRKQVQHFNDRQELTVVSFLDQIVEKQDVQITSIVTDLSTLKYTDTIRNAVLIPKETEKEEVFNTENTLNQNTRNMRYVDNMYLYESTHKYLYSSTGAPEYMGQSIYSDLITDLLYSEDRILLPSDEQGTASELVIFDGCAYLIHEFYITVDSQYLGYLIAQLNMEYLFADLDRTIRSLPYNITVSSIKKTDLQKTNSDSAAAEKMLSYQRTSDITGWMYTLQVPHGADFSIIRFLEESWFLSLLLLLIAFVISGVIAFKFYDPIYRLLQSFDVKKQPENTKPLRPFTSGEMKDLSQTYKTLHHDKQSADAFIALHRTEIESRLLLDLITGKDPEEIDLANYLQTLQSPLSPDGCYQCFIIALEATETVDHIVQYMAFDRIREDVEKKIFDSSWGRMYFLLSAGSKSILIIQYADGLSVARIKKLQQRFYADFTAYIAQLGENITLAAGNMHPRLQEISLSYSEANEQLRKVLYYSSDNNNEETAEEIPGISQSDPHSSISDSDAAETEGRVTQAYYLSQVRIFAACIGNGEINLAKSQLSQLLNELCVEEQPIELVREVCTHLLDTLVEQMLRVRVDSHRLGSPEYQKLYEQLQQLPVKDLRTYMLREATILLDTIQKETSTRQHRTISQAKEFIHQNYSNSSLSIHEIAEACSISDSYLSTLFTEYTDQNLLSYLNIYRIEIAKDLLANTQIIIKDIGFKTGFNTIQNFNRVFKKIVGITPGEYRKQYRL